MSNSKNEMTIKYIDREEANLSKYAAKSVDSFITRRLHSEKNKGDTEGRLCFQRDRDRIIHSRAFRRLMHKTQVFNANSGDHYRNRLTHTLEVSQISRSIGKYLALNDELIEAIALGHDLGHTPFGHVGERTLHLLISGRLGETEDGYNKNSLGGFKHNYQSLQVIDNIEKRTDKYNGLNLTLAVRDGIIKHTSNKIKIPKEISDRTFEGSNKEEVSYNTLDLTGINLEMTSMTLEGQVVGIADEIAQCTHDLEDGIRAGIITIKDLNDNKLIETICSDKGIDIWKQKETVDIRNTLIKYLVGDLICDVCRTTKNELEDIDRLPKFSNENDIYNKQYVKFSADIEELHKELSSFITKLVIASVEVTQSDIKAEYIIKKLFKAYYNHPQQLPDYILNRYFNKKGKTYTRLTIGNNKKSILIDGEFVRLICDHIGSMSDQFASREYKKLFEPDYY